MNYIRMSVGVSIVMALISVFCAAYSTFEKAPQGEGAKAWMTSPPVESGKVWIVLRTSDGTQERGFRVSKTTATTIMESAPRSGCSVQYATEYLVVANDKLNRYLIGVEDVARFESACRTNHVIAFITTTEKQPECQQVTPSRLSRREALARARRNSATFATNDCDAAVMSAITNLYHDLDGVIDDLW